MFALHSAEAQVREDGEPGWPVGSGHCSPRTRQREHLFTRTPAALAIRAMNYTPLPVSLPPWRTLSLCQVHSRTRSQCWSWTLNPGFSKPAGAGSRSPKI